MGPGSFNVPKLSVHVPASPYQQGPLPVPGDVDRRLSVRGSASTVGKDSRGYDAGRKINRRERRIVVDTLELPVMITVTPGDAREEVMARDLRWRLRLTHPQITQVWTGSAYSRDLLPSWTADHLWLTLGPVLRPRGAIGFVVLPRRWKVERSIGWIMNARRICRD
ncbi:transposase [Streptomyces sp. NPDC089424]|uniref:transposase n=1 Tax=Streptomyces sp. NPDC089424 TaxID=3365917 RepID=UPI003820646E